MRRLVLDLVQCAGMTLATVGVGLRFGWTTALIIAGAGLVLGPWIDTLVFRRGG